MREHDQQSRMTDYQRVLDAEERHDGTLRVTLRRPTLRYLNELVELRCAPDLLALGLFPNAKEVTESFACFRAARSVLGLDPKDPSWTVIVIGDGTTPRTAATFAFRTKWRCWSVDPALVVKESYGFVSNLYLYPQRIENLGPMWFKRLLVVAPHSHADLGKARELLHGDERHFIALPCCEPQNIPVLGDTKFYRYDDWGVWSPARSVLVWRNA